MPNHASVFLRGQLRMSMTDAFERSLTATMDVIAAAGLVGTLQLPAQNADLHKLPKPKWTTIYTKCQNANMKDVWGAVGAARINADGWFLYWADNAGTKELLMIGRWAGTPVQFQDYFGWALSSDDRLVLNGDWVPVGRDNTIDMAFAGNLKFSHQDKHFGAQRDAAQYTIGASQAVRKRIVAGMEEKAMAEGLVLKSEAFFRFNATVGTDGQGSQNNTTSIRVDTPGGPSQHSHPIPENQAGMVSHDGKVKSAIRIFTTDRDLSMLVELAKYLTIIGVGANHYTNLRTDVGLYGHLRPPPSHYWSW